MSHISSQAWSFWLLSFWEPVTVVVLNFIRAIIADGTVGRLQFISFSQNKLLKRFSLYIFSYFEHVIIMDFHKIERFGTKVKQSLHTKSIWKVAKANDIGIKKSFQDSFNVINK